MNKNIRQHWLTRVLLVGLVLLVFFALPFIPLNLNHIERYGLVSDRVAPDFTLMDAAGRQVSLEDYRDKFVFLMFGYLNCKDVCHSQALIFQEINFHADMKDQLHFLYIAMDPERDSASRLAAYFDGRAENFTSLRSEDTVMLQSLAGDYRAFFAREGGMGQEDYDIRHAGFYFLIGPDGHIRHVYSPAQKQSKLVVNDLKLLRQEYKTLDG